MDYSAKQIQSKWYFFPGRSKTITLIWALSLIPILIPQILIPHLILLILLFVYDVYNTNLELKEKLKNISFKIDWPGFMELNRTREISVQWDYFPVEFFLKVLFPTDFSPRIHTLNRSQTSLKLRCKKKGTYDDIEIYVGYRSKLGLFIRYYKLTHSRKLFVASPILYLSNQEKYYQGKMDQKYQLGGESDFYGIRTYQFGDTLKKINWGKTAGSYNEVYVNEYQKEKNRKIIIALNTGMASRFDYKKYQYIDYQTAIAFQLAHTFTKNHDETGLLTFSGKINSYVPPDLSRKQMPILFNRLQNVQESYEHMSFMELYLFLRKRLQRKSILVLLSPFLSFEQVYSQQKVIYLLAQEYQVIWLNPMRLFKYYYEKSNDFKYLWARVHLLKEKESINKFFKDNRLLYINDQPEKLYRRAIEGYFSLKW